MAHFAKVENSVVTQVIAAEAEFFDTFVDSSPGEWLQTSYDTHGDNSLRKNYAGIGMTYDSTRDAFIVAKPYPSWTLNEDTCQWQAPVAMLDNGKTYTWDEATTNWKEVT